MGQVVWAPSALEDLDALGEYIARDSVDRAALLITRVIEIADRLQDYPFSGRVIPEVNDKLCREIILGSYRIMYRIEGDEVWITGVVHGARNWKSE
jgi:addiction module RelE/StbE family toxin